MKAIILSAGRGTRLLPLTQHVPKCLLPIDGRSVLEWQLGALAASGVDEAVIVTGFGASYVEDELSAFEHGEMKVRTHFNPLYACSDNLVSCLSVRSEMDQDFVLLNGDTLVEPDIVRRLLASAYVPVSVGVVRKQSYDSDDMKVYAGLGWLDRIGKHLDPDCTSAEAIGISVYRGTGPDAFVDALEDLAARPDGTRLWYLSAVDLLAWRGLVRTASMDGLDYAEIDCERDLVSARRLVRRWHHARSWHQPPAFHELHA
jgi:L-glutamine-phosphate cytidylyltransferase